MDVTLAAEWRVDEPRLRVAGPDAQTALRAVTGQPAVRARARLRFGPGRTCEPIAWLLDRAIVRAEAAGLDPALLVVAGGSVQAAEDIVRVRKAYGAADWIPQRYLPGADHPAASRPLRDGRTLIGPGHLYRRIPARCPPVHCPPVHWPPVHWPPVHWPPVRRGFRPMTELPWCARRWRRSSTPISWVNIVDLGFVRAVTLEEQTAVITMTLTSAACPLTGVMEEQIRTGLAALGRAGNFRIDWQWIPAGGPLT